MGKYNITIKSSDSKEIKSIDSTKIRKAIVGKISSLAENPRPIGATKLTNQEKYRVRQGNYRILYQIFDDLVEVSVVKVGHRKDVYT